MLSLCHVITMPVYYAPPGLPLPFLVHHPLASYYTALRSSFPSEDEVPSTIEPRLIALWFSTKYPQKHRSQVSCTPDSDSINLWFVSVICDLVVPVGVCPGLMFFVAFFRMRFSGSLIWTSIMVPWTAGSVHKHRSWLFTFSNHISQVWHELCFVEN